MFAKIRHFVIDKYFVNIFRRLIEVEVVDVTTILVFGAYM